MHRYFIAYVASVAGGGMSFGNWSASRQEPIRSADDILEISSIIEESSRGFTSVTILSWQHFED